MNLLLVSIDSLRLDFVSRLNPGIHTPHFDALSRDFCFFSRLFSTSSATRPVHASLFTGLYPFEHGVLSQRSPRQRAGLPDLFEFFRRRGFAVAGFSEAVELFTGLDCACFLTPLAPESQIGLGQIDSFLRRDPAAAFLFVHYWSTHAPYGAPDGRADGEILRLLERGQLGQVQERYAQAVEILFEEKLAPLLARLDLRRWSIFILSDHGESWTPDEPYHGCSLRNAVLRVPLYFHLPGTGNPPPSRPLLSIVDLLPTFAALFDLPAGYWGFGRDLRSEERPDYYLAQIHPVASAEDRPDALLVGSSRPGPQWALFDANFKFTFDEARQWGRLEKTLTEERVEDRQAEAQYLAAYARLQAQSPYAQFPLEKANPPAEELLERRLKDLGYLS